MNIQIKDRLRLSDKKNYLVTSKILYNNEIYYLLTEFNNFNNSKICLHTKKDTLKEINDEKIISMLIPYFTRESLNMLREDNL